jgi:spermidine synthase
MRTRNWIIDYRGDNRANMYRIAQTIATANSQYQEILIVDTPDYGRALFLDGNPQSAAIDEHIYHETLVHPALAAHSHPQKVFIAGGGEGAVLREVLKHNTIEQVVMVDIDTVMVDMAKKYLTAWHAGAFEDKRVKLVHDDARAYLENTREKFDCIILDATDPLEESPAALLFTTEFFKLAKARLAVGGTFAMQAESTTIGLHDAHVSVVKTLRRCFKTVLSYQMTISFFGLEWGFVVASDTDIEQRFAPQTLTHTLRERDCKLQFYDVESHLHMFAQPKYLRDALEDPNTGKIIADDQVLVVEWA